MNSTSNHSWNAGDRPTLRVTPAGMKLLAYMDYVTPHTFVSLAPTDTVGPEVPPEQYDDERTQAGTPSPKWGDYSDDNRQSDDSFDDMDDDDELDGNLPMQLNGGDDPDDMDDDDYGEHSPEED